MGDKTERLTMTISEFAELSGISRNLAYSLARESRLHVPIIKLGKRLLLSRKAVLALLDGDSKPEDKVLNQGGRDG